MFPFSSMLKIFAVLPVALSFLYIVIKIFRSDTCGALAVSLPGRVFYAGRENYSDSVSSYFFQQPRLAPSCVVRPQSTEDVSRIVVTLNEFYDRESHTPLFAVKSGGHSPIAGAASLQNGVTVDLGALNRVDVSRDRRIVTVGPGAQWQDVYRTIEPLGIMVNGGRVSGIGVGGFLTGGGISYYSPGNGWGCDNVADFELVLANGSVVHANANSNQDLFKSLKGGSNNFGIVTNFQLNSFPNTKVWGGLTYTLSWTHQSHLEALANFFRPDNFDSAASIIVGFIYGPYGFGISNILTYARPVKNPLVFRKFDAIRPKIINTQRLTNISDLVKEQGKFQAPGERAAYMSTVFEPSLELFTRAYELWRRSVDNVRSVQGLSYVMVFQPLPLTRNDNALGLEAGHPPLVICLLAPTWRNRQDDFTVVRAAHRLINDIERATKSAGAFNQFKYLNYVDEFQDPISAYGARNKANLQTVSKRYDPEGFYQNALTGPFKLFD